MGVAAVGLAVFSMLLAAAGATRWIEGRGYRTAEEKGPAAAARMRTELAIPQADRWMYLAGPLTALFGVAAAMVVIPFGPKLIGADLGIGVFYLIVVVDFAVLGLSLGGWGANTRNGTEVYYRATAQLVSYVVPLGLAYIGAVMMAKSLSTVRIVEAQSRLWLIIPQPIGFALYVVTALMQSFRPPFSEPFSAHIESGVLNLFGGWKALIWRIALSGLLFVVSAMGAVLYLGGWQGPLLPGPVWMLLKTTAMMALLIGLGTRVKPRSTDQMLQLSWKVLTPVGLLNVLIVGGLILLGVGVP
jgi:NADH-quinone oxidoreductase subunit H